MIALRAFATIPDMINHVFGTDLPSVPPNTYGTFVALGFLAATLIIVRELRRREAMGLVTGYHKTVVVGGPPSASAIGLQAIIGFIIGLKGVGLLTDFTAFQNDPIGFIFSGQGSLAAGLAGALVLGGWTYHRQKKAQLAEPREEKRYIPSYDQIGDMVFIAAVFGVLGAKLFEMLQPGFDFQNLLRPETWFSGLTIFGGLIVAGIAMLIFARRRGLHIGHLFDTLGLGFMPALGIGRLGCHFSGDGDWGKPNPTEAPGWIPEYFWSNDYAHSVIGGNRDFDWLRIDGCTGEHCLKLAHPVWPTSIYEFVMCIAFFGLLWAVRKRVTRAPGMLFFIFLVFLALERFFIEFVRVTDRYEGIGLTQAQVISVGLFIIGVAGAVTLQRRHREALKNA